MTAATPTETAVSTFPKSCGLAINEAQADVPEATYALVTIEPLRPTKGPPMAPAKVNPAISDTDPPESAVAVPEIVEFVAAR